jgi:hypothetical protein
MPTKKHPMIIQILFGHTFEGLAALIAAGNSEVEL